MKEDKVLKVTLVFLLVIQIALVIYFIAMAGHYVSLENTAGVIYNLFFALINIPGIISNISNLIG